MSAHLPVMTNSPSSPDTGVVLPCAGSGTRVGTARPKQFLELGGRPMFHRPLSAFLGHPRVATVVLVVAPSELHQVQIDLSRWFGSLMASQRLQIVEGGAERWQSVKNGVEALPSQCRYVAIHDVARPFLAPADIDAALEAAEADGAATLAIPCPDTVKWIQPDPGPAPLVERTLDRKRVWLTQTPQTFRKDVLETCYASLADLPDFTPTDEASIAEALQKPVRLVPGSDRLRKVTTADDLEWARWMATRALNGIVST